MSNLRLHLPEPQLALPKALQLPIGRYLVNEGIINAQDLVHALELQCHLDAPIGEILVAEGLISRDDILSALSRQHNAQLVNLDIDPPRKKLAAQMPSDICLTYQAVPWMKMGDTLMVATHRPDQFDKLREAMGPKGLQILPVIAELGQVQRHIGRLYGGELAQKAATRVPASQSCRTWNLNAQARKVWALVVLVACLAALTFAPMWTMTIAMIWAFVTLLMSTALKAAAFWSQMFHTVQAPPPATDAEAAPYRLPRISMLVPLLKEKEIAGVLLTRLALLTYPKSQLDVVLVLEQGDTVTRETISRTDLPEWIRVIEVPEANSLTTKPRALNYALDFCQGSIVGVWDAEDAPEPDQLERVAARFQHAPANVACLQGILDYYNTTTNWISRCFTIEYATWWRMILPGIARLGFVVPLGGTTLFFRRDALEDLCGWDAHNVTEDADLGVRLARNGYTTELLHTVTYAEANFRAWPWVKQRSRWLKGFLITWCVHMRNPGALLRDLGWMRFLGVQTLLLATFSQFICAPLLWSFGLTLFGVPHPVELTLGAPVMWGMAGCFICAEVLSLSISMVAVSDRQHRHLLGWVLTLPLYFPMGVLAAYKGLHEFIVSPFYWDKTEHGVQTRARK
jgi:cellulose synthase/poly-beta-1,6-N-acetylglucosamine synthase-like glycosyltransferase